MICPKLCVSVKKWQNQHIEWQEYTAAISAVDSSSAPDSAIKSVSKHGAVTIHRNKFLISTNTFQNKCSLKLVFIMQRNQSI